jgi:pyruvate dehydrogenase E2 component (dihydrolipoamide acetyltransferase)
MTEFNADKVLGSFGGEGPPIALVHGFGADRFSWLGTAPDLVKHATVYTIELPGHGNAWDLSAPSGLDNLCKQTAIPAIESIASQTGSAVHLVGHSLGGALAILAAQHLATQSPAEIASLTLLAPLGLGAGGNKEFIHQLIQLDDADTALNVLQRTVHNRQLISSQLIQPMLQHLRRNEVRATLRTMAEDVLNPGSALTSAVQHLAECELPKQVAWGHDDNIIPPVAEDAERVGGDWHFIEACGHLPHVEHRTKVNRLLIDMVQRVSVV